MNTNNSFSSTPMSKKRERLTDMLDMRAKTKRMNQSTKGKKLNAHLYKKMFQIAGQKAKQVSQSCDYLASNEVDETLVMKSCSGSKHETHRVALDLEGVCFGNPESANEPSTMDGGECDTLLKMDSEMQKDADMDTHTLKERLSPFAAPEIKEYWVSVHLSQMQIQQYCSLLHSNFEVLMSTLKNSSSLHDIVTQTKKCCDHPYLVDPTLRNSLETDNPIDPMDAEINVSGKLQLLDKLLLEIKRSGLRAVVLYRSVASSENISIGDILDDLVDQRFGQHFYIRIQPNSRSNKKEALKTFNNIETETFICLLDYRACTPSVRLSSVDVVILFNSDWNPLNDLKALHKITLNSHSDHLEVFRLYSSFTIEEKALILSNSKQSTSLDSHTHRMTWNTCHQLLAWGASYLFSKNSKGPSSESESDIDDLVRQLSSLLLNKNGNTGLSNSSIILNARMHDGTYPKLLGETEAQMNESCSIEMEDGPFVFWTNLFKESHGNLDNKYSRLSRRVKKSFRNPCYWFEGFETENEDNIENLKKYATTFPCAKRKMRSIRKLRAEAQKTKSTGAPGHVCDQQPSENVNEIRTSDGVLMQDNAQFPIVASTCISAPIASISSTDNVGECPNNKPPETLLVIPPVSDQSSNTTPLETELENIKKQQEQATKLHQEKKSMLLSECEKEISEIRKKYDALIVDSEKCLTEKMEILEEYNKFVYANKLLAETLCDDTLNEAHPGKTEKETNSVRILEIPASALVQVASSGHNLHGTGIRAPAPHLRRNPSFFANLPKKLILCDGIFGGGVV